MVSKNALSADGMGQFVAGVPDIVFTELLLWSRDGPAEADATGSDTGDEVGGARTTGAETAVSELSGSERSVFANSGRFEEDCDSARKASRGVGLRVVVVV